MREIQFPFTFRIETEKNILLKVIFEDMIYIVINILKIIHITVTVSNHVVSLKHLSSDIF